MKSESIPTVKPEWRTADVLGLCRSMREAQDWSARPILADALQDAGCDDEALLALLRGPSRGYAPDSAVVACVLSDETREAVALLSEMHRTVDCPSYVRLVNAASGHHEENRGDTEDFDTPGYSFSGKDYHRSENDGEYLHFGGTDAHGMIPAGFWEAVALATGAAIPEKMRATDFSCSC